MWGTSKSMDLAASISISHIIRSFFDACTDLERTTATCKERDKPKLLVS